MNPVEAIAEAAAEADKSVLPTTVPVTVHELRVLTTTDELLESYRMRYEVYRELGYLMRPNKPGVEIDEYDAYSIPFGAFDVDSGELVGTLRLITSERQAEYDDLIGCVIAELGDRVVAAQAFGERPHRLPSITNGAIDRQITAFNTEQLAVHELSRFIVRPSHRSSHIWRGLAMLGLAHAMQTGPAVLIAGCLPKHVRLYASYGFAQLPNTGLDLFDSVGQLANTIACRSDALPQPMQSHVAALLEAMISGASEHVHDISRNSRAMFRLGGARRSRRRTLEWQASNG